MLIRLLLRRTLVPRTPGSRTLGALHARALAALLLVAGPPAACDDAPAAAQSPGAPAAGQAALPGVHRQYGPPVQVGDGRARTYVVLDQRQGDTPVEIGVALDERALDGLPAPDSTNNRHPGHGDYHQYLLPLPARGPAPYRVVELGWNPAGHPDPIYGKPHFDVHFYTISDSARNAIDPADAQYAAKAAHFPESAARLPGWLAASTILNIPPVAAAVPRMGVHWAHPASPELPPVSRPFTTTFLMGTWDGQVIFYEPMVTRAFILGRRSATTAAQRDSVIPLPTAQHPSPAGYYPSAYRVAWDPQAKEYRVALTQLARRP